MQSDIIKKTSIEFLEWVIAGNFVRYTNVYNDVLWIQEGVSITAYRTDELFQAFLKSKN
jgi:hypothetical protein